MAITEEDFAKLVTCVSVIDETNNSAYNNSSLLNSIWNGSTTVIGGTTSNRRGFRTAFPYRTFYILDPQSSGQSGIDVPTDYPSDPNAFGPIRVNRDGGNAGSRSDWFDICNFGNLPYGTIVSIWIDVSGSMTLSTVQASYDYFLQRCAAAGIEIVLSLSASGERYIDGHIQYLPPSANFTAVDSDGNTNNIVIKQGESVTLSWIVFGDVTQMTLSPGVVEPASNSFTDYVSTAVVSPTVTTTYNLAATGPAGTTTRDITITVLVLPVFVITTNKAAILLGDTARISWSASGNGGPLNWTPTLTWLAGGITNGNLTSYEDVSPTDTTTYTGKLSGIGGEDTGSVTVTVYQPVELSVNYPFNLPYGNQGTIEIITKYATESVTITPTYNYDFVGSTSPGATNLTANSSAELGDSQVVNTYITVIPYTDRGPLSVSYVVRAEGPLGNFKEETFTIPIIVDITPENLNIPESDELLKDQTPVVTPEVEVLSELILIDDVDIKVEVKADQPIQVQINDEGGFKNVRSI